MGSRFRSERMRRVALSLLMLTVLSCTVISAKLYTRHVDSFSRPPLELQTLGVYRVGIPMGWTAITTPVKAVDGLRTLGQFVEPATNGRTLTVYQLRSRSPLTPEAALLGVMARFKAKIIEGAKPQLFRTTTLFGFAIKAMSPGADGLGVKHLIAVLTLDGRRYLVVDLTGSGKPSRYDSPLLTNLAASVQTTRYRVVESPVVFNHDIAMRLPDWLLAVEPARSDTGHYLVVPVAGAAPSEIPTGGFAPFAMIDTVALDLTKPLVGPEGLPPDSKMPVELQKRLLSDRLNPSERIVISLMLRYWQLTGKLPPADSFRSLQGDHGYQVTTPNVTAGALDVKGLSPQQIKNLQDMILYRSLYVLRLDANRAIMLDIITEPNAKPLASLAAIHLLRGLYDVNYPPPTTPETSTPETSTPQSQTTPQPQQ